MFSIGADVELFIRDETNKVLSAINRIPGTKENKYKLSSGAELHCDNVLAEFNTVPAYTITEWENNILDAYNDASVFILDLGLYTHVVPSAILSNDQLMDYEAFIIGCDPDFDAWDLDENIIIDPLSLDGLRTAGGHIHIGGTFATNHRKELIRTLDMLLGLPSILLDKDKRRKKLYGKSGRYRNKPYGVEYRVLSNFWINYTSYIHWIYNTINLVCKTRWFPSEELNINEILELKEAINNSNEELAIKLIKKYHVEVPSKF